MTHSLKIPVDPSSHGKRLDRFLAVKIPGRSRNWIQNLIADKRISIEGKPVQKARKVCTGEMIHIIYPDQGFGIFPDESVKFSVIYEDDHILVINKPVNTAVHPGAGVRNGTLVNGLLHYDPQSFLPMLDEQQRPGIVHRLDKDTSGVMVISKNDVSKKKMVSLFKLHKVSKAYLAIVHGTPKNSKEQICTMIGRNLRYRHKMAVVPIGGKKAETEFEVLSSGEKHSLLYVKITTGRTHQIRVHLAHYKHPILGDKTYSPKRVLDPSISRPMLHAFTLRFPHPSTNKACSFAAEIPHDFVECLNKTGLNLKDVARCLQT